MDSSDNKLKIINTPLSPNGDISPAGGEGDIPKNETGQVVENQELEVTKNPNSETKRKKVAPKKEKVFDLMFVDPKWQQLVLDWLTYRKETNKQYQSQRSVELFYEQLREFSGGDGTTARKIINRSIANGYQGIFKLTDNGKSNQNGGRNDASNDQELMRNIAAGCRRGLSELQRKGS